LGFAYRKNGGPSPVRTAKSAREIGTSPWNTQRRSHARLTVNLRGTRHFGVLYLGIAGCTEPTGKPLATRKQRGLTAKDFGAIVFDARGVRVIARSQEPSVLRTEIRGAPLVRARIERTHTSTGDEQIELSRSHVASDVNGLHDHRLAGQCRRSRIVTGTREVELEALATVAVSTASRGIAV